MGRRRRDGPNLKLGICKGTTLREENLGKKEADVSSILKMKHLQKLAAWAGGEGRIPPLGAFFGYHLAANAESLGLQLDKSIFLCQRCETILQPGYNCTIRIEKCKNNKRKRSKNPCNSQNNVIYKCNFCQHRNSVKGTSRWHIKNLISSKESKSDSASQSNLGEAIINPKDDRNDISQSNCLPNIINPKDDRNDISQSNCLPNPAKESITKDFADQKNMLMTPPRKLVDLPKNGKKMGKSESGKVQLSGSGVEVSGGGKGSSRRKRKAWSSLKDLVERKEVERNQNMSNYVIPFFRQVE